VKVCGKEKRKNEFGNYFSNDLRGFIDGLFNLRAVATGKVLISSQQSAVISQKESGFD